MIPSRARFTAAFAALLLPMALGVSARPAAAQVARLAEECQPVPGNAHQLCLLVAQAIETGRPRAGIGLTAGNPVPGTASTLGFRLGRVPRATVGGRAGVVRLRMPPLDGGTRPIEVLVPGLGLSGSLAVAQGFSPLPTIGGIGSVDLLAGMGVVPVPDRRGLRSQSLTSFGAGARLGLLRESFTMPGVSVSVMRHWTGDIDYGDPDLRTADAFFQANLSTWSIRGAVGKRILTLGATAGLGHDRYSGRVRFGVLQPELPWAQEFRFDVSNFRQNRTTAFANLSWTTLILHLVAEVGWQAGGNLIPGLSPQDVRIDPEAGALYGSVAARVSI